MKTKMLKTWEMYTFGESRCSKKNRLHGSQQGCTQNQLTLHCVSEQWFYSSIQITGIFLRLVPLYPQCNRIYCRVTALKIESKNQRQTSGLPLKCKRGDCVVLFKLRTINFWLQPASPTAATLKD